MRCCGGHSRQLTFQALSLFDTCLAINTDHIFKLSQEKRLIDFYIRTQTPDLLF